MTWQDLRAGVEAGERRALARAITLVESTRPDHREEAAALLDAVLPRTGNAIRVGISGPPGVGKSTFIEALGLQVLSLGESVAVLAVDPSSSRSGGSVLGDKTRMEELSRHDRVYIRPSPSAGALGGVARRTREAMLVCEAAGFSVVLVETVGVGQSETEVDALVDTFVLLQGPGAGDELQGIKRGVVEMADVIVVTKADGALRAAAQQAAADLQSALQLLRPKMEGWDPSVVLCSAYAGEGVAEAWDAIADHHRALRNSGQLEEIRREQARRWMWDEVEAQLLERLRSDAATGSALPEVEQLVMDGRLSPASAARRLLGPPSG